MCGIFGWQVEGNNLNTSRRFSIFASVLMAGNDTRGGHSWGYAGRRKPKHSRTKKLTIKKGLGNIVTGVSPIIITNFNYMMGHTRYASHGARTIENAHPFRIKNIIGSHNGIVSNHKSLNEKYKRNFEVDSMHIFEHIANGIDVDDIEAYGAIEYIKKENPEIINLCCFNGGELAAYRFKGHKGIFWSSSEVHVKEALKLSGLKATQLIIEENKIYTVHDNEVYQTKEKLNFKDYSSTLKWNSTSTKQSGYKSSYGSTFKDDDMEDYDSSFYGSSTYQRTSLNTSMHTSIDTKEKIYTNVKQLEEQERLEALSGQKLLFNTKFDVHKGV